MIVPKQIAELEGHQDHVWHASWNSGGTCLASCSGDQTVRIWAEEGEEWKCVSVLSDVQTRTIRSCEWSPCGRFIAAASFDGTIAIWEKQGRGFELIATLEGHENEVKCVAWKNDGSLIASCSRDKSIWLWEGSPDADFECVSVLHGHSQDVKSVMWHPTEDILFSSSYDDTVRVWREDGDDWSCTQVLNGEHFREPTYLKIRVTPTLGTGHSSTVWGLSLSADGRRLASASDDKSVIIWEANNEMTKWTQALRIAGFHKRTIFSVDWNGKSNLIATGDGENSLRIFRLKRAQDETLTSELVCELSNAHDGDVNCVRWNPKSQDILCTAGDDDRLRIWSCDDHARYENERPNAGV